MIHFNDFDTGRQVLLVKQNGMQQCPVIALHTLLRNDSAYVTCRNRFLGSLYSYFSPLVKGWLEISLCVKSVDEHSPSRSILPNPHHVLPKYLRCSSGVSCWFYGPLQGIYPTTTIAVAFFVRQFNGGRINGCPRRGAALSIIQTSLCKVGCFDHE